MEIKIEGMAQSLDGRSNEVSELGTRQPKLPPVRGPWIPPSFHRHPINTSDDDKRFFFELPSFSHRDTTPQHSEKHQRASSPMGAFANGWLDKFVDLPAAKSLGMHRRSASDSAAFPDANAGFPHLPHSEVSDRDTFDCGSSSTTSIPSKNFGTCDEEHILSILKAKDSVSTMEIGLIEPLTLLSNSGASSTPYDHNNGSETFVEEKTRLGPDHGSLKGDHDVQPPGLSHSQQQQPQQEDEMQEEDEEKQALVGSSERGTMDLNVDPKRVRRILANRQSAQRSRIRKLHYIAELEGIVSSLQVEVSSLSPQVAYLHHQRLILNVENSALKQRIAALVQDKLFKDAHIEMLNAEVRRLRCLYQQQCLQAEAGSRPIGFESDTHYDNGNSSTDGIVANN